MGPISRWSGAQSITHSQSRSAVTGSDPTGRDRAPHKKPDQLERNGNMANVKESLEKIMATDGAIGTCVVDSNSGMMLGAAGGGPGLNIEVAAAGNTEVVRAKRKTMKSLGLNDAIEDILITLGKQY